MLIMKIEFDLLQNGLDSIDRAIELIAWKDEPNDAKRLKQAILAMSHGIEQILKERLRRVHPSLIWDDVDKFPSLSARTVTVDIALNRLIKIGGLEYLQLELDLIRALRDTRNAIEHYSWTTTKSEADRIVGQGLGFALHFIKDELQIDLFGYESRRDDTFSELLNSNSEFSKAFNMRHEKSTREASEINLICDFCHAMSVNPRTGACKLCGHWSEDLAENTPF
jgi:arsenate reductase-like glutaredoxin family protein